MTHHTHTTPSPGVGAATDTQALPLGGRGTNQLVLTRVERAVIERCHAFLVHEGHPTSAKHLEPLLRAATCAVLDAEMGEAG